MRTALKQILLYTYFKLMIIVKSLNVNNTLIIELKNNKKTK